jgi:hypothetical protein
MKPITMKAIFSIQRVYNLHGATVQIRLKLFNKVVFRFSFKPTLNPI